MTVMAVPVLAARSAARLTSLVMRRTGKPESYVPGSTQRGKLTSVAALRPEPLFSAATTLSASMSYAAAMSTASAHSAMAPAHRALLSSLMTLPDPGPPMCRHPPAVIASSSGAAVATVSGAAPTNAARVPAAAPDGPPDTGASTNTTSCAAALVARPTLVRGSEVDVSTISRTESSSRSSGTTALTCSAPGRESRTCSVPASSSMAVTVVTPALRARARDSSDGSQPSTDQPRRTSIAAIAPPIAPRPITATDSGVVSLIPVLSGNQFVLSTGSVPFEPVAYDGEERFRALDEGEVPALGQDGERCARDAGGEPLRAELQRQDPVVVAGDDERVAGDLAEPSADVVGAQRPQVRGVERLRAEVGALRRAGDQFGGGRVEVQRQQGAPQVGPL